MGKVCSKKKNLLPPGSFLLMSSNRLPRNSTVEENLSFKVAIQNLKVRGVVKV